MPLSTYATGIMSCHVRKFFFQYEFNYNGGNECENSSAVGVVLFKQDRQRTYK
jgi:hypothetical protein